MQALNHIGHQPQPATTALELDRYFAQRDHWHHSERYALLRHAAGGSAIALDFYRTRGAAEYAARLMNSGACRIDHHRPIGCRVVDIEPRAYDASAARHYRRAAPLRHICACGARFTDEHLSHLTRAAEGA